MNRGLPVLVAAAFAAGSPALAQSAFTGPYVGAQLGFSDLNAELKNFDGISSSTDGLAYGVYGGYGYVMPNSNVYVAGEVEYGDGPDFSKFGGLSGADLDAGPDYGISGIVGYVAAPNILLYGRLGYQWMETELKYQGSNVSNDYGGWRVGAGVDYAFTPNIRARAEYIYTDYGSQDFQGLDVGLTQNLFRVGLTYSF